VLCASATDLGILVSFGLRFSRAPSAKALSPD
jgi:hypothetical protein